MSKALETALDAVGPMSDIDKIIKALEIATDTIKSQQAEIERLKTYNTELSEQLDDNEEEACSADDEIMKLQARVGDLELIVSKTRNLIDQAMGDTDPFDPDDPLLQACQTLSAVLDTKELTPNTSTAKADSGEMGAERVSLIDQFFNNGALGKGKIAEERRDNGYWLTELYNFLYSNENQDEHNPLTDEEAELHALYHRFLRGIPSHITQTLRFLCKDEQLPRVVYTEITESLDALIEWRESEPEPEGLG